MCDVCTEGRLLKGKKTTKKKTKTEKEKRKKAFQGALVPQGSVPPWTWPKNDHRAAQVLPRPDEKVGGDGSLKANELMLTHKNANRKI